MKYTGKNHTFAVCAHGSSVYLTACLKSLAAQSVPSRVILCASKENDLLTRTAKCFGIPLRIRGGDPDIAADWNFAYKEAQTELVTLAHQDDLYAPRFLEMTLAAMNRSDRPLIAFTDYVELKDGHKITVKDSRNLKIKKVMLAPFKSRILAQSRFVRRRILSLGSPICCPSVTYVRKNIGDSLFADGSPSGELFTEGLEVDLDWDAWERISRLPGSFCYVPVPLCAHRIHADSATTRAIGANVRRQEDLEMFEKFWPKPAALLLNRFYGGAQKENTINGREKAR